MSADPGAQLALRSTTETIGAVHRPSPVVRSDSFGIVRGARLCPGLARSPWRERALDGPTTGNLAGLSPGLEIGRPGSRRARWPPLACWGGESMAVPQGAQSGDDTPDEPLFRSLGTDLTLQIPEDECIGGGHEILEEGKCNGPSLR
jgi:hypothetical protein